MPTQQFYDIFIIFMIFVCIAIILVKKNRIHQNNKTENFEKVKIKLKQNPLNLNFINSNDCQTCNSYPDIVVPIYAPWKTYWPANSLYPYYPFYPFYYNNYY